MSFVANAAASDLRIVCDAFELTSLPSLPHTGRYGRIRRSLRPGTEVRRGSAQDIFNNPIALSLEDGYLLYSVGVNGKMTGRKALMTQKWRGLGMT